MTNLRLKENQCALVIGEDGVIELILCNPENDEDLMPLHSLAASEMALMLDDIGIEGLAQQFKDRCEGESKVSQ